jgi:hypothetical protein
MILHRRDTESVENTIGLFREIVFPNLGFSKAWQRDHKISMQQKVLDRTRIVRITRINH